MRSESGEGPWLAGFYALWCLSHNLAIAGALWAADDECARCGSWRYTHNSEDVAKRAGCRSFVPAPQGAGRG